MGKKDEILLETRPEIRPIKKGLEAFKTEFSELGNIKVVPYVNGLSENMGLEKYGMVVFPDTYQEEQLAATERNGVIRFITGLDEFAPEIQSLTNTEEQQAIIHNIRSIIVYLEKMLATNVIDIDDPQFWNKVKLVRPDNISFWNTISIRCGNDPVYLSPLKDPYDLIKLVAIEAGGFTLIAKSYEDAMAKSVSPKWYLDKEADTTAHKATYKRLRNTALSILDKIANKDHKKLLYLAKIISDKSFSYINKTSTDILYEAADNYIVGEGVESNKTKSAEYFIELSKMDMESLKVRALVKDAAFYKTIVTKADGMIYHARSATMLGRNVTDVGAYLKNPINEEILISILQEVEVYWNK